MTRWRFVTNLVRPEGIGTWTFAPVPFDLAKETGSRGFVRVRGTVDGESFAGSVQPGGDGTHFIVVKKSIRDAIGKAAGDRVTIEMELDLSPIVVSAPADLAKALGRNPKAKATFERLAPSHKKAYVEWIQGAKRADTRKVRIGKAVLMLSEGRTLT